MKSSVCEGGGEDDQGHGHAVPERGGRHGAGGAAHEAALPPQHRQDQGRLQQPHPHHHRHGVHQGGQPRQVGGDLTSTCSGNTYL
jgi:hypothetical protein